ncbi:hypothetical protein [Jiangella asiatica]|uniref:hypothetical protein n=1 Tax=Jiangella asiatica TaxID=2530372 RepID=UPI001EF007BD|nr:hypothetical protein [Jiangella asiatica]
MKADIGVLDGVDPHEVLGVRRGASPEQVTRAFHREALRGGHPDTGGDARAFRRLVVARDVLLREPTPPRSTPARARTPQPSRPPSQTRTPPPGPPAADADWRPPWERASARPAPVSSGVLPLLLIVLFLVGVPALLRILVIFLAW